MTDSFDIAIIGAGPAGISAGARAASRGASHVLLERTDHLADTIYKYSKGKHVMSHPEALPLRSDVGFGAGARERVLATWDEGIKATGVNLRFGAEVTQLSGERGNFTITLKNGETIAAKSVVLSMGNQGDLKKLPVDGADWEGVQYQLDDPDAFTDETIVVLGTGDSGVENALALARQNRVIMVNRGTDFPRPKEANRKALEAAIASGEIECHFRSTPARVQPGALIIETGEGEAEVACNRIIARLGANPPRRFLESAGIKFATDDRGALPELSDQYESVDVPGLYIVGELGGYQLIKRAMNQGQDVIGYILGEEVTPVDEALLAEKFGALVATGKSVSDIIDDIRATIPLLSHLTRSQLREFLLDATVHDFGAGDVVFRRNDFTNSVYMILTGAADILVGGEESDARVRLDAGEFFGEIGLIAGRRRSATVECGMPGVFIEAPRNAMFKLISAVQAVAEELDNTTLERQIKVYISQSLSDEVIREAVAQVEKRTYKADEVLFREGDEADGLYLIRRGSVKITRNVGGREVVLAYSPAGHYVGEMAVLSNNPRNATVSAAIHTDVAILPTEGFRSLMARDPNLRATVETEMLSRLKEREKMTAQPKAGNIIEFLVEQKIGDATDILLIDESLCIHCDNCERACADTHMGISRLDREAGATFARIHVPTSCRHCEHPHCMADCPPDAIDRADNGEVFINDSCIGCGNCQRNCPYGVIQMAALEPKKPSLLSWLMFGLGREPGRPRGPGAAPANPDAPKLAVKCDLCRGIKGGPACVRSCPTGAAQRVSPEKFLSVTQLAK